MSSPNDAIPTDPILVVEAQDWERDTLFTRFPTGANIVARAETLQEIDDSETLQNARVLSTFVHSRVDTEQLDRLPAVKLIAVRASGLDHIDLDAARSRGIAIANVPDYGIHTVAEHTFALLLAITRKIHRCYERTVRGDFSLKGLRGSDLHGKTLGVLGTGRIGRRVIEIARGFGMRVIAHDIEPDDDLPGRLGFDYVDFDRLLTDSEIFTIHVPYNKRNHHLVDAEALTKLPLGAIVINTSRGGVLDTHALVSELKSGHLGGAGLDVLEGEEAIGEEAEIMYADYDEDTLKSVIRNHALLSMPNVIITPHVAFNSHEAVQRIVQTTVDNVMNFLNGSGG